MNGYLLFDNKAPDAEDVMKSSSNGYILGQMVVDENPRSYWSPYPLTTDYLTFDFGSGNATQLWGWALLGHNLETDGATNAVLKVGAADSGSTFDITVSTLTVASVPGCEPDVAEMFDGWPPTKRYWRVEFTGHTSALKIGEVYLAGQALEFTQAPDAPYERELFSRVGQDRLKNGGEIVTRRGAAGFRYSLSWDDASSTEVAALRNVWDAQGGEQHLMVFVDHRSTAYGDFRVPAHVVNFEGPLFAQEYGVGDRFRVTMRLKDLV
jgi:hypothetical protein